MPSGDGGALIRAKKTQEHVANRTERLVSWLEEKWGASRPCPYCGNTTWQIDPAPVHLPRFKDLGVIPGYMVTCSNCANTVFILAEAAGLGPDD